MSKQLYVLNRVGEDTWVASQSSSWRKQKVMDRTGFGSQMRSSALHLSTLHCMSFLLNLGIPRIQVFCIISQVTVSRFFVRKLQTSSLPAPWLTHQWDSSCSSGTQTGINKTAWRSHNFRAWIAFSALYSVLCVLGHNFTSLDLGVPICRMPLLYKKRKKEGKKDSAKSCPNLAALWIVACQPPPFLGFSMQEYWNGLPFPSPGDLPNPGIEPRSPALQADSLLTELSGRARESFPQVLATPNPASRFFQTVYYTLQHSRWHIRYGMGVLLEGRLFHFSS